MHAAEAAMHVAGVAMHVAGVAMHVAEAAMHVAEAAMRVAEAAMRVAEAAMRVAEVAMHVAGVAMHVAEPAMRVAEVAMRVAGPTNRAAEPANAPPGPRRRRRAQKRGAHARVRHSGQPGAAHSGNHARHIERRFGSTACGRARSRASSVRGHDPTPLRGSPPVSYRVLLGCHDPDLFARPVVCVGRPAAGLGEVVEDALDGDGVGDEGEQPLLAPWHVQRRPRRAM